MQSFLTEDDISTFNTSPHKFLTACCTANLNIDSPISMYPPFSNSLQN